jgi:hypothetical protein
LCWTVVLKPLLGLSMGVAVVVCNQKVG